MKTGVSTASLFGRTYNEEALPLLNDLGVKHAEVFLTTYSEYEPNYVEKLRALKGEICVNSVHILNTQFEPQLFNTIHPRVKADAYALLEKTLNAAVTLGAPYYTFHGTARIKRASRSGERDDFPCMIKAFKEISAFCQKHGVALCLENVEWATYNRVGVFEILAREIEELRGVLDIKQSRISGYLYKEYLKEMGKKIAYVHVSDVDERGKMCLPGQGSFDFEELVLHLKDVQFDGALLVEAYQNDYKTPKDLKIACDYLNEILYKPDCLK